MKKVLILLLVFIFLKANSQFYNHWYFGLNAGLNFNTIPPTILSNGTVPSFDNSSTISDNAGNLLFYTDGVKVWNQNNTQMPNGFGLIGNFTAGACALIVPIPCDNKKYVIFHTTEFSNPGYLNYSVVDMNLNGGLGDVVVGQKNISLGSGWTEKLCAYYNSTNNCYWVLAHKWMSNQFVAFRVDATTIATTSVVSSIGSVLNCGTVGGAHDAMGQLTISPDGSKVINALTCQDRFEIFNFNQNTGVLSNSIIIPGFGGNAWGTAFSPNSQKIYLNSIFGSNIYQYDISTYNQSAIVNSSVSVYNTGAGGYNFGYFELGPNGKVYVPRPNTNWLSVINSPNLTGPASNFSFTGQSTGAATAKWGLSRAAYNIPGSGNTFSLTANTSTISCGMTNGSATIIPSVPGNYTYTWSPGNYTTSSVNNLGPGIYTVNVTNSSCVVSSISISINAPSPVTSNFTYLLDPCNGSFSSNNTSNGGVNYSWNFGDGSFSSLTSPSHTFSPGTYTISLIASNNSGCSDTIQKTIIVNNTAVSSFSYNLNMCDSVLTLNNLSTGTSSCLWNFGDGASSNVFNPPAHLYTSSGQYTISLTVNPGSPCAHTSSAIISVYKSSVSAFTTTPLCFKKIKLENSSLFSINYLWLFGDGNSSTLTNPEHMYSNNGTYTIQLITNPGTACADTSAKTINITNNPTAEFKFITNPCSGVVTFTNTSVNANNYKWIYGDGYSSDQINPSHNYHSNGTYNVKLITMPGEPCADTINKKVVVNFNVVKADFEFECIKNSFYDVSFLNKSLNASTYYWEFSEGKKSNLVSPVQNFEEAGLKFVCLYASDKNGCSDTICKSIDILYDCTLYIPNTFTPDGNGLNETFHAYGTNIVTFSMTIYDRWGEKLFSSNDITKGWDGFYKGVLSKEDVYVWKISAIDSRKKTHELVGHVNLIR